MEDPNTNVQSVNKFIWGIQDWKFFVFWNLVTFSPKSFDFFSCLALTLWHVWHADTMSLNQHLDLFFYTC